MAVYLSTQIPAMDWSSTDMAESLRLFKQKMNLFLDDENIYIFYFLFKTYLYRVSHSE